MVSRRTSQSRASRLTFIHVVLPASHLGCLLYFLCVDDLFCFKVVQYCNGLLCSLSQRSGRLLTEKTELQ